MITAAPKYLGDDFKTAPPGHRFGLYFSYWHAITWKAEDKQKGEALKKTLTLPDASRAQIGALEKRQSSLIAGLPDDKRMTILAKSISPLATGMGMEHPLENGFAFLNPYGLPYLPGSSIKGVLRRAAQELSEEQSGGWDNDWETALFGLEPPKGSKESKRGALTFWDSIPEIAGGRLGMDVMTPHYSDYYQGKSTPHDAGQPIPIVFMVIPPKSEFTFHITCEQKNLPESLKSEKWKSLMEAAFSHAFDWLGFGAKTAVGYGAMEEDLEAAEKAQEEAEKQRFQQQEQARRATLSQVELDMEEIERQVTDNNPAIALMHALENDRWDAPEDMRAVAHRIQTIWDLEGNWIPNFSGTKKQKVKQKDRCQKVVQWLES